MDNLVSILVDGDTIYRQAAIDAIGTEGTRLERNGTVAMAEIKQWCVDILEAVPTARSWIPCSEQLPKEEEKDYWVCTDTGYQCQCEWTSNVFGIGDSDRWGWKIFDIPQYSHVVAWMPLPKPYEEGGDGNG